MAMITHSSDDALSAEKQMDIDKALISSLDTLKTPLLRTYTWQRKSITFGYFLDPERYIDCKKAESLGIDYAIRPTGGGMLFHWHDLAFTVALPAAHPAYKLPVVESYRLINAALLTALNLSAASLYSEELKAPYPHLCMATPSKYDLLWNGKKIGGAAQRRTKAGLIHQSALFLALPDWDTVRSIYRGSEHELHAMKETVEEVPLGNVTRNELISNFCRELSSSLECI